MADKASAVVDAVKAAGKCDVRLTAKELEMLRELADANGVTKSDIMRDALRSFHRWCTEK